MNKKEIKELQDRAKALTKAIQKNVDKVIWLMIIELIEIELDLEAECNK